MLHLSTQEVVLSIEKSPVENLNGMVYQEYINFFGKDLNITIKEGASFVKLEGQEQLPRVRLDYKDILIKKLKVFFMNNKITKELEKKFKTELSFASVDIWMDNKGYFLEPHTDDKRIKLALQIYLTNDNVGTSLMTSHSSKATILKTFEFKSNCGYALLNNDVSFHGLESPVEHNGRISVYVRYI
jgi:hypothetical protein